MGTISLHLQHKTDYGTGATALAEITTHGDTLWTKKFNRAGNINNH
jgi:hypothetical protein